MSSFAARWTGFLDVPRRGRYVLSARASDGVRVWVDGRLRIVEHERYELHLRLLFA